MTDRIGLLFWPNVSFAVNYQWTFSIDNRYCNRFFHLGRPIFSVNHNGASLYIYRRDTIWDARMHLSVLHSRSTGHPICNLSQIIATRCSYSIHYVSNICIYFQSRLLCFYKLNCNRFNRHERPIFFSAATTSSNPPFFLLLCLCDDLAMKIVLHKNIHYNLFPHINLWLELLRPVPVFQ